MPTLTPSKQQNFLFVRKKLETKMREFKKAVFLDSRRYGWNVTASTLQHALRNDIVVSHSGRTLAEILSLSHSKELSLYTVDDVVPGYGKEGTVVRYSHPESELDEFRREVQEKLDIQQATIDTQQAKIIELEKMIGENSDVLTKWQTASLVICAFDSFAWNLVSLSDKAELQPYNIHKFWDLYYAQTKPGLARNFARRIYHKIDENVTSCANNLVGLKGDVARSRRNLAHPLIPEDKLNAFLSELGLGNEGLEPIEIEMFKYLASSSNDPKNVECTIRGG